MKMKAILIAAGVVCMAGGANAQSTINYTGQVIATAATFCPIEFMETDGAILLVEEYEALYSLIGNEFGGEPPATFALPTIASMPTKTGSTIRFCICTNGIYPEHP